jgi:hypothetical protein
LLSFALGILGNAGQVLAHGGEDHGNEKPKTATTEKGTITRTARLGDFEIMLKHSPLEPDAASSGRLFITRFATNEPADNASPAIEIESQNGAVIQIPVEKSGAAGSYVARFAALPEGVYTVRTKLTYSGETDTATFSGIEIAHQEAAAETSTSSWRQTALLVMLFLFALVLFGSLIYFTQRQFKNKPLGEETASA